MSEISLAHKSYQISSLAANSFAFLQRNKPQEDFRLEIPPGAWVLLGKRLLALTFLRFR